MATLSSLLEYYYETMQEALFPLEEERKRIVKKLQTVAFFMSIGAVVFFTVLHQHMHFAPLQAGLLSAMSGFLIFMFVYRHEKAGFTALFKDQVIEKLLYQIDASLSYRKESAIDEEAYRRSELFLEDYDRFEGSDLVSGSIAKIDVRFSFLHTQQKERDSKGRERWETIFQGLFFCADFNKAFKSKTVVLPDTAERTLGVLGTWFQRMNVARGSLMKLDHAEFEKIFVVYGDDPIESRYILSHSFMEKIVLLQRKINRPIYLSFVASRIYIAIAYTKSLFEPILTRSLLEFSYIKEYFQLLNTVVGIVEELKLNEKLWSKR
ncbi:DUF3137 domain-containing protein [Sulfurospirillum sp. MES]|jgi:hypothetical protein|uniref:DUF3137 domain-containing protein n=1 Tax=Sulfurospirillum sp. MES TaxID=1565314 RepID=UPI00054426A0|nr:DUF3137 domain-containing protein [Sulfurospirillum sp. MES]KHG34614.1 MAG: hypothetical protein OA34_00115 [Sulfurospirillum sp. MES]